MTEIYFGNEIGAHAIEARNYERANKALDHTGHLTAFRWETAVDGFGYGWHLGRSNTNQ